MQLWSEAKMPSDDSTQLCPPMREVSTEVLVTLRQEMKEDVGPEKRAWGP